MADEHNKIKYFVIFIILQFCMLSIASAGYIEAIRAMQGRSYEDYQFDSSSSVISRVIKSPDLLIEYLRKYDNDSSYTIYVPNETEMKTIEQAIDALPALNKRVMQERVIGIYFVNNFLGTGYTDCILDKNGEFYIFLAFNPGILKRSANEWLTSKERTCFIGDKADVRVEVTVDTGISGFFGILLHESAHAVDYVRNITPYIDNEHRNILEERKQKPKETEFVKGVWEKYKDPLINNDYEGRKELSFYGMNKGPHVKISDSSDLYKKFSKSPFVSLYGSMSWSEDLAEFILFYHLTQKMDSKYEINVYEKERKIFSYQPMKSEKVKMRFKSVEEFYE